MRSVSRWTVVLVAILLLAGCRSAPVYNVERSSFNATEAHSVEELTGAIQRAGTALGWRMDVQRPGLIHGTLNIRTHEAVVEIPYDSDGFAIRYLESTNLDYEGDSIHSNYNGWVQNLERQIRAEVSAL